MKQTKRPGLKRVALAAAAATDAPDPEFVQALERGLRVIRAFSSDSPDMTIADVADTGTAPEQVVAAARQAIERGLTTRDMVRNAARGRGRRVEHLVEQALSASRA